MRHGVEDDGQVKRAHPLDEIKARIRNPAPAGLIKHEYLVYMRITPGNRIQIFPDDECDICIRKAVSKRTNRRRGEQKVTELIVLPNDENAADRRPVDLIRCQALPRHPAFDLMQRPGLDLFFDGIPHGCGEQCAVNSERQQTTQVFLSFSLSPYLPIIPELEVIQLPIQPILLEERRMRAGLQNPTTIDDDYPVCVLDGR